MHPSLRLAGLLPPLDMHHHFRRTDNAPFREGVVVEQPQGYQPTFGQAAGCFVDVGLDTPIQAEGSAAVGQRVTVRMGRDHGKLRTIAKVAGVPSRLY
jgi:predicted SPOUT superfamily RNA methylase MTH1